MCTRTYLAHVKQDSVCTNGWMDGWMDVCLFVCVYPKSNLWTGASRHLTKGASGTRENPILRQGFCTSVCTCTCFSFGFVTQEQLYFGIFTSIL